MVGLLYSGTYLVWWSFLQGVLFSVFLVVKYLYFTHDSTKHPVGSFCFMSLRYVSCPVGVNVYANLNIS